MKRKLSELLSPVPSDIDIAQAVDPLPITDIAADIGLELDELVSYGQHKAKVKLSVRERLGNKINGNYIDVTAITPTPLGEGKTTTIINLAITFANLGKKTILIDGDLRKPVIHKVFDGKNKQGLTHYLSGAEDRRDAIIHSTNIDFNQYSHCISNSKLDDSLKSKQYLFDQELLV